MPAASSPWTHSPWMIPNATALVGSLYAKDDEPSVKAVIEANKRLAARIGLVPE